VRVVAALVALIGAALSIAATFLARQDRKELRQRLSDDIDVLVKLKESGDDAKNTPAWSHLQAVVDRRALTYRNQVQYKPLRMTPVMSRGVYRMGENLMSMVVIGAVLLVLSRALPPFMDMIGNAGLLGNTVDDWKYADGRNSLWFESRPAVKLYQWAEEYLPMLFFWLGVAGLVVGVVGLVVLVTLYLWHVLRELEEERLMEVRGTRLLKTSQKEWPIDPADMTE
jgi:hypothetical protein